MVAARQVERRIVYSLEGMIDTQGTPDAQERRDVRKYAVAQQVCSKKAPVDEPHQKASR